MISVVPGRQAPSKLRIVVPAIHSLAYVVHGPFAAYRAAVHPPMFRIQQLLSDWPDCSLELSCSSCGRKAIYPVGMMRKQFGDQSFEQLIPRLKCKGCGAAPAPVYLCASHHRVHCGGPPPDWAVLLVPPPKP